MTKLIIFGLFALLQAGTVAAAPTARLGWRPNTSPTYVPCAQVELNRTISAGDFVLMAVFIDEPVSSARDSYKYTFRISGGCVTPLPDAWRFDSPACQTSAMSHHATVMSKSCPYFLDSNAIPQVLHIRPEVGTGDLLVSVISSVYPATHNFGSGQALGTILFDMLYATPGPTIPEVSCGGLERPVMITLMDASWRDPEGQWHDFAVSHTPITSNYPSGQIRFRDRDGDGFGDPLSPVPAVDVGGCVTDNTDCDDFRAATNPNAPELPCNFIDDDCDGQIDEGVVGGCDCISPPHQTLAWWKGDGNADDAAGTLHGSLQGAGTSTGKIRDALSFDGVDDHVAGIGSVTDFAFIHSTGVFTIDAWVNLADVNAPLEQAIAANLADATENGYFLTWDNSTGQHQLRLMLANGGSAIIDSRSPAGVITTGGWHHVAVRGDGSTVTFYVDGTPSAGTGVMAPLNATNASRPMELGRCPGAVPSRHFHGLIDEVHVFSRSLLGSEITALSQAVNGGMCECTDEDGDGFAPQGGIRGPSCSPLFDCDDTDPTVFPGNSDWNCNGLDNDCDGSIDGVFGCACVTRSLAATSWWQAEGGAADILGNNPATWSGTEAYAPGEVGTAFALDGASHLTLPDSPDFQYTTAMTVEGWIRPSASAFADEGRIFAKFGSAQQGAYELHLTPGMGLAARIGDGTSTVAAATPDGVLAPDAWAHVGMTLSAGTLRIYVNGAALQTVVTPIATLLSSGSPAPIIGRAVDGTHPYTGLIDELSTYDQALSSSEMNAVFATGSLGTCDPSVLDAKDPPVAGAGRIQMGPMIPNPTRSGVSFSFTLLQAEVVRAEVLDITGRRVASLLDRAALSPGTHRGSWNGRDSSGRRLASGVYLIRISTETSTTSGRVLLLD